MLEGQRTDTKILINKIKQVCVEIDIFFIDELDPVLGAWIV